MFAAPDGQMLYDVNSPEGTDEMPYKYTTAEQVRLGVRPWAWARACVCCNAQPALQRELPVLPMRRRLIDGPYNGRPPLCPPSVEACAYVSAHARARACVCERVLVCLCSTRS